MTNKKSTVLSISKKKLESLLSDDEKTARAANLVYVSDRMIGISRIKKGKSFSYYLGEKLIKDDEVLLRIKHLVIPPAWKNVWICKNPNGHLQVTGTDARGRKQYKYHPDWILIRNRTKFYRLAAFGRSLPGIRACLQKDLSEKKLTEKKVLAAAVSMMENTGVRVGNAYYEREYNSVGLTTLKDKHVQIKRDKAQFSFIGKKGIAQQVSLHNKKLIRIIKQCKEVPGKELFQYYDEAGKRHSIDSGMVNQYIKEISNADFTAKDFRTWTGTVHAFMALKEIGPCESISGAKKNIIEALDKVSAYLGNTRSVCRKYYVHPTILTLYENKKLDKYLAGTKSDKKELKGQTLSSPEKLVLRLLESN